VLVAQGTLEPVGRDAGVAPWPGLEAYLQEAV
jgi:hypothetical protein